MHYKSRFNSMRPVFFFLLILINSKTFSQMITGVWKGKIDKKKTELKIIQKGDSLLGTSYYYESENNYRRYSIRGYFDPNTNQAVWWDDQLLEEKSGKMSLNTPGKIPYLSSADFNCPGSDKMFLEGNAALKNNSDKIQGPVNLQKTDQSLFRDEWDFIIDNYTVGASDPYYIDSIASIAGTNVVAIEKEVVQPRVVKPVEQPVKKEESSRPSTSKVDVVKVVEPTRKEQKLVVKKSIEEEFKIRERVIAANIPVSGDSIELRFYDNAEIDGDSISLFLNNKLLFQHIRLTASAYIIKLPVNELSETNELVMVAENLGSIPPNTSYMLAIVNNQRYEAMLKSTEESSAVIKLTKPKDQTNATKN